MEGDFEDNVLLDKISNVLNAEVFHQYGNRDDTCFQKFGDLLRRKIKSSKLVEQCGIIRFLKTISAKSDVDASSLVFTINLTGILVHIPDLTIMQEEHLWTFLDLVLKHHDLTNPSIGTAYFDTLGQLLEAKTGRYHYIQESQKELLPKCWKLLADGRSLFLTSAIVKFLRDYISNEASVDHLGNTVEDRGYMAIVQKIVDRICQVQDSDGQTPSTILRAFLQLLRDLPGQLIQSLDKDVVCTLCEGLRYIISNMDKDMFILALEALLALHGKLKMEDHPQLKQIIQELPQGLAEHDILRSQYICIKMLENGLDEVMVRSLLLCPLYVLIGQCDQIPATQTRHITDQMKSKVTCVQMVQNSLETLRFTNVPEVAIRMTAQVLKLTLDGGGTPITCHILGSTKIQQKCLDMFMKNPDVTFCMDVCSTILDLVKAQATDCVTYSKCLDVLCLWTPGILQSTDGTPHDRDAFSQSLTDMVQRHLCGIDWERRDTTMEFLTKLLSGNLDNSGVTGWMLTSHLGRYVFQALDDSNSYMRASALTCLQTVLQSLQLTSDLLQQCDITFDGIFWKVLSTLESDTEAFARRESVKFITKTWNSMSGELQEKALQDFVGKVSNDFDWEVKLKLITFWEMLTEKYLTKPDNSSTVLTPSYATGLLPSLTTSSSGENSRAISGIQELVNTGCLDSLYTLLDDYDQSVCEQACVLLQRVMDQMADVITPGSLPTESECSRTKQRKVDISDTKLNIAYRKLESLDLKSRLLEVSASCDEYDKNPLSLLEDMLAYCNKADPENEDNAVDCY